MAESCKESKAEPLGGTASPMPWMCTKKTSGIEAGLRPRKSATAKKAAFPVRSSRHEGDDLSNIEVPEGSRVVSRYGETVNRNRWGGTSDKRRNSLWCNNLGFVCWDGPYKKSALLHNSFDSIQAASGQ